MIYSKYLYFRPPFHLQRSFLIEISEIHHRKMKCFSQNSNIPIYTDSSKLFRSDIPICTIRPGYTILYPSHAKGWKKKRKRRILSGERDRHYIQLLGFPRQTSSGNIPLSPFNRIFYDWHALASFQGKEGQIDECMCPGTRTRCSYYTYVW